MSTKLIVKRHSKDAILPKRASEKAAGYDLCSSVACQIDAGQRTIVATDLSITVPPGTYGRIAPRSGLAVNKGIDVMAGVIDQDYTGKIGIVLINHGKEPFWVQEGSRVGQLILERIETPEVEEVQELASTERGDGGFGSTGIHSNAPPVDVSESADDSVLVVENM